MLNLGMSELLLFAIIAVIILGPDKLPTAIRSVMKWYRQIKMLVSNVQRDIERELEITEIREKMESEISRFKAIEQQMQAQLDQIQKEVDQIEKNDLKQPIQIKKDTVKNDVTDTDAIQTGLKACAQLTASEKTADVIQDMQQDSLSIDQHKKVATV